METSSSPSSSSSSSSSFAITSTHTTYTSTSSGGGGGVHIPVEIVSEEEMAFIEAALASTRPFLASSACPSSSSRFALFSSLTSILPCSSVPPTSPGPRSFATSSDIEDTVPPTSPGSRSFATSSGIEDIVPPRSSLLDQFRSKRGLSVTDFTSTEWCEKQMEFLLHWGKPKRTEAMKAGSDRHSQLEKEVSEKIELHIKTIEDSWAIRLMNFIVGTNHLLFEGITRELPVLQLMCYKFLWDNLVTNTFPTEHFFRRFELNRQYTLTGDIKKYIDSFGLDLKYRKLRLWLFVVLLFVIPFIYCLQTLDDVLSHFRYTSSLLSQSDEQLLLRYELQSDQSLLEEYYFPYDSNWLKTQINRGLEFWLGHREASFVSEDEKWKCQFCDFVSDCPISVNSSRDRTRSK
ncbi:exonuclease V, chloroplastic-like isoform X3 [Zingiber officinale]|uniref:exonuclease V, chloroplastic-like isoform X3 n=1 Tax=Zingiber officinale TaxID=94328 RepID=UPI001C4D25E3|nr:exonuclease V, chloroplastic-like isoform X3 [Zingiber officinale]